MTALLKHPTPYTFRQRYVFSPLTSHLSLLTSHFSPLTSHLCGGYELGLQPIENENSSVGENVETYWGVEDIDAAYAHAPASGATEHQKPNEVGDGIRVATVKDPWGNIVGIIYNPHFRGGK